MGLSVFPAPSTGPSIPEGLKPPKITYNQHWSLTGLSGITNLTNNGGGNILVYRKTDNSLYFTGKDAGNLWRFNLTSNTASTVVSGTFNNNFDMAAAQDGTLYRADNMNVASASNYAFSTDGGVNWTSIGNSNAGPMGFLTLIDNGHFPGVTGNVIFATRASTAAGPEASVSINNGTAGVMTRYYSETRPTQDNSGINLLGGMCLFPVRDGDDSPASSEKFAITDASTSSIVHSAVLQNGGSYFRYATIGRHRESGNNYVSVSHHLPDFAYSGTVFQAISSFGGTGRPTSIQNRWLVGVNKVQGSRSANFYIHDYDNNLQRVGGGALRIDSTSGSTALFGQHFSNPVYISATKKLYVWYGFYQSGSGDAQLYEYNVTTY